MFLGSWYVINNATKPKYVDLSWDQITAAIGINNWPANGIEYAAVAGELDFSLVPRVVLCSFLLSLVVAHNRVDLACAAGLCSQADYQRDRANCKRLCTPNEVDISESEREVMLQLRLPLL